MENSINKNLRICKKCLTRDMMDKADYFKSMYDYIENLDPDIKTEDSLYEKRLATCFTEKSMTLFCSSRVMVDGSPVVPQTRMASVPFSI